MRLFEKQIVTREQCPVRLGPQEPRHPFGFVQNKIIEDVEFADCEFIGEGIATYRAPVNRSTLRNASFVNCAMNSFFGLGAVFEEIAVDGLRMSGAPAIFFGSVFRHVALKGRCGRFLFNRDVCHDNPERVRAFQAANDLFYESVDWALDISQGSFSTFEIRGSVPARLIRRNPDEHFVMTREVALSGDWKHYDGYECFQGYASTFIDSGVVENVFVAEKLSKRFKMQMEYFHRIKAAGLVS